MSVKLKLQVTSHKVIFACHRQNMGRLRSYFVSPGARFSKVPKNFGPFSDVIISSVS